MTLGDFVRRVSVPSGYMLDPNTIGPTVPEGWVSEAWFAPDGCGCFLRAWNDNSGQIAIIQSETSYMDAANRLRRKIQNGGDWLLNIIKQQ